MDPETSQGDEDCRWNSLNARNHQPPRLVGGAENPRPIPEGPDLTVPAGEIHAIMGPNGAGKSTLSNVLGGKPGYEVTAGSVTFRGEDLLALEPHERAAKGLFLGFQYPVEIPGVSNVQFLREALNAQRKARGEEPLSGGEFLKLAKDKAALLKMDMEMLKRQVNVGFSGGEKKRAEMVQMGILDPAFAVLDETDSGLDIDRSGSCAGSTRSCVPRQGCLLIHHYTPARCGEAPQGSILAGGRIARPATELASARRRGYDAVMGDTATSPRAATMAAYPIWMRGTARRVRSTLEGDRAAPGETRGRDMSLRMCRTAPHPVRLGEGRGGAV